MRSSPHCPHLQRPLSTSLDEEKCQPLAYLRMFREVHARYGNFKARRSSIGSSDQRDNNLAKNDLMQPRTPIPKIIAKRKAKSITEQN
jgi:hypothetical protein